MASNSVNTGSAGQLVINANVVEQDWVGNSSKVEWSAYFNERGSFGQIFGLSVAASVYTPSSTLWSGSFGVDWRGGGSQSTLIASGSTWFPHRADGTGDIIVAVNMGSTPYNGTGGPASVDVFLTFPTILRPPNAPSALSASRVSDTQVSLSWNNNALSNGQPQTNDIEIYVNGVVSQFLTINASSSATVAAQPNQKLQYRVRAWNASGPSAWTGLTPALYTTPAAPTDVVANKQSNLDIVVGFAENVSYSEYNHEVQHGVVSGSTTTWDAAILTTLASGVLTYRHVAPNAGQVHVYRVRAKQGSLTSAWVQSNSVQLLVAPNKPTIQGMASVVDRTKALAVGWVHNSVDTSPMSAYEFSTSTNGGTSWTTTGKVTSTVASRTLAASAYAANTQLSIRVRTWGAATTGGSDNTGASPWSDVAVVTFKSAPVATINSPAVNAVLNDSTLRVTLGFSQAEAATFVKAELELLRGTTLVETLDSNVQVGIIMDTPLQNGQAYTVRARVQDSNGLWSAWKSNAFTVTYLPPVPATVTTSYIADKGFGQINLVVPIPSSGQSAATTVTVTRTINGKTEVIVKDYPAAEALTFLDTTPTIHGTNTYVITTLSALGSQTSVTSVLVTDECRRAFLSKGTGFNSVGVFGGNLEIDESLSVASSTVEAAGRLNPIGLYGVERNVQLKVNSYVFEGFGSTLDELRDILLMPGKACYRDPSGRRVFGTAKGGISRKRVDRGEVNFTMTETS